MTNKTDVLSYGCWNWNQNGEVRCSKCNSLVGVAFRIESYTEIATENKYCYNCGLPMLPLTQIESVKING